MRKKKSAKDLNTKETEKTTKKRKPRRRKHEVNLKLRRKPRGLNNPKTRSAAINAMCWECIYDPNEGGTWRAQVEACVSPSCPLYKFRPLTSESLVKERKKRKLRKM